MFDLFISILSIYFFIFLGFLAKKLFKEKIDDNSITLISIYFLQPILAFWGITQKKIDLEFILIPIIYLLIILLTLFILLAFASLFFKDKKVKSIFTISPLIGNTGNLGIPIGIELFGPLSAAYTNIINLANVFIVYTFGVFFYSRGNFSVKESLLNILKMPVLWVALIAVTFNLLEFSVPSSIDKALTMGAYSSMVIQLFLFGIYMSSVKIRHINFKLSFLITVAKFAILPLIGSFVISFFDISSLAKGVLLLELIVPLAVTNAALAKLYNCNQEEVTAQIFISSLLFLGFSFFMFPLISS